MIFYNKNQYIQFVTRIVREYFVTKSLIYNINLKLTSRLRHIIIFSNIELSICNRVISYIL